MKTLRRFVILHEDSKDSIQSVVALLVGPSNELPDLKEEFDEIFRCKSYYVCLEEIKKLMSTDPETWANKSVEYEARKSCIKNREEVIQRCKDAGLKGGDIARCFVSWLTEEKGYIHDSAWDEWVFTETDND